MTKTLVVFFLLVFTLGFALTGYAAPDIAGKAFVLIDGITGQVLYGNEANTKLHPASTTKIMTVILALEKGKLDEKVTISKNVPLVEGTKVYLREGEQVTLESLLYAAMVHSANDAAVAIAEHIAGSEKAFAKLMNERAQEIGAKDTNFVNAHGLTDEEHLSTAYDLALIGRYAMQNAKFRELAQTKVYDWEGLEWQTRTINKNSLLWQMSDSTGIKPGYTSAADYTLVASAQRDNTELISVILGGNGSTIWNEAERLLDYGFENFQNLSLVEEDAVIATININEDQEINLVPVRSTSMAVPINEKTNIERKLVLKDIDLPINEGQILGELIIFVEGKEVDNIPLKSLESLEKPMNWVNIVINAFAAVFLLQIFFRIIRRIFKRRRQREIFGSSRRVSSYRL